MNNKIRFNDKSISYSAKKIKKSLQSQSPNNKSPIGYNEIINIIHKAINNKNIYVKSSLFNRTEVHQDIIDLQDLKMLSEDLKNDFKQYGNIESIDFIEKIQNETIEELFNTYHEMSIIDYFRNYNVINNRSVNDGAEIKTYQQVVDFVDLWIEDIYDRFKETIKIKGTNVYPIIESFKSGIDMNIFEMHLFIKNKKNRTLSKLIYKSIYLIMKGESDLAKKIILKEIKDIYIQHQEETDEVFVHEINKYYVHIQSQEDINTLNKYRIPEGNFTYFGKKQIQAKNKIDLVKSKLTLKRQEYLFIPEKASNKNTLFIGEIGAGGFSMMRFQLNYKIVKGAGFIHFNYQENIEKDSESTNYSIEDLKNFIRKNGKGQKLIVINYRQLLKLKEEDVIAFINKNKFVYINLKYFTAMTEEEIKRVETQVKMIIKAASKANAVVNNGYILNLSSVSYYSQTFFDSIIEDIPLCNNKGIVINAFFDKHLDNLNKEQKLDFSNLFGYNLIFRQKNSVDLLNDLGLPKDDMLANEILNLEDLIFIFFENKKRKLGFYKYEML